jgi:hypothetical protein
MLKEHLQKEIDMNKKIFVRLAGLLLMVGALAFLPGAIGMLFYESQTIDWNTPPMRLAEFAVFWAPVLLAVGMLGLRARYRMWRNPPIRRHGRRIFGHRRNLGAISHPDYSVSETYYGVWLGGVLVLNGCLSIFGILALIQNPCLLELASAGCRV